MVSSVAAPDMAEPPKMDGGSAKTLDEIIREAKRLEESSFVSFTAHHFAARRWRNLHLWLGIPTVVIATIVGFGAFLQYAKEYPLVAILGGLLSLVVAVLSGITTFLNPKDLQAAHLTAAHGYDALFNNSRIFWSIDCCQQDSDEVLISKLRKLVERKIDLNRTSPQIPRWAWKGAKKRIAADEATLEVDKRDKAS